MTPAVLFLALATGCTGSDDARPAPGNAAAGDYRPPADAPGFCVQLAGADLGDLPSAVGRLVLDPGDTHRAWQVTAVRGELEEVRAAVRRAGDHGELETALDEVIDALALAAAGPLTDRTVDRIVEGLDAVGTEAQPVCEFPV